MHLRLNFKNKSWPSTDAWLGMYERNITWTVHGLLYVCCRLQTSAHRNRRSLGGLQRLASLLWDRRVLVLFHSLFPPLRCKSPSPKMSIRRFPRTFSTIWLWYHVMHLEGSLPIAISRSFHYWTHAKYSS